MDKKDTKKIGILTLLALIVLIAIFLSSLGGKITYIVGHKEAKNFALGNVNTLEVEEISKKDIINEISDEQIIAVTVLKENNDPKLLIFKSELYSSNTKVDEEAFKLSSPDLLTQIVTGSSNANASDYPPQCPHSYKCITKIINGDTWHRCVCI